MLNVEDIIKASKGNNLNSKQNIEIKSYCIDSREVKKEDFFIPIVGNKVDAHNNIIECVNKGIIGYFINSNYENKDLVIQESIKLNPNINIIEVENTKKALYDIGRYNRQKHINIPVIAVTGSVGKTSTREMIASIFETKYNVLKTERNYNSDIGISLMLLKIENQDFCILEAGISDCGEMEFLSELLQPIVATITNIGTAHIEFFKSRENIFREKLKITSHIRKDGCLILNDDDEFLKTVNNSEEFKILKYSLKNAKNIVSSNDSIEYYTSIYGKEEKVLLNVLGQHNIYNSLCAIKIAEIFNVEKENILNGLKEYNNFDRRFQIIKLESGCNIIDDAYNASYDSMKAGLETFNTLKYETKIVVLGDMLELGDSSKQIHEDVGKLFQNFEFSKVFLYGEESKYIEEEASKYLDKVKLAHYDNKEKLIDDLKKEIRPGVAIYFKASNGIKFNEIIKEISNK